MRLYTLQRAQWVARPLAEVFPFFAQPENLAQVTPPGLDFRLLTPTPVRMERGRVIDYTIRVLGARVRWRTLISTYEPPHCFVDEQLAGPYSFWHHTHRFREEDGGTRLSDEVRYALPAFLPEPLAAGLHRWQVAPMLEEIFDYRHAQYRRLFGAADAPD